MSYIIPPIANTGCSPHGELKIRCRFRAVIFRAQIVNNCLEIEFKNGQKLSVFYRSRKIMSISDFPEWLTQKQSEVLVDTYDGTIELVDGYKGDDSDIFKISNQ